MRIRGYLRWAYITSCSRRLQPACIGCSRRLQPAALYPMVISQASALQAKTKTSQAKACGYSVRRYSVRGYSVRRYSVRGYSVRRYSVRRYSVRRYSARRLKPAATFLLLAFLLVSTPAHAAIQWSLSVVEGYYLPRLDELNYILKHQEVELGPRNTEAKPFPYPVIYQGISPDDMPEMSPKSPKVGLQLQADVNPRYAVVFGGSMAVFDSVKRDVRPFFVGFSIPANRETRFSLALNQFWLGAKRYWIFEEKSKQGEKSEVRSQKSEKIPPNPPLEKGGTEGFGGKRPPSRFYAEMGILAITRAYLTTDVWLHVYAPEEGFDFYKVTETGSQGNGYSTYLGVGGEYYIRKWLSIGLDIDYTVGGVSDIKFVHYFTVDPLEKDIIKPGDRVFYTDFKKGRIRPLFIDLEGWDFKGQVRVFF